MKNHLAGANHPQPIAHLLVIEYGKWASQQLMDLQISSFAPARLLLKYLPEAKFQVEPSV